MPETPQHAPGTFCWIELGSSDQEAARSFYTSLFGWTADDVPMDEEYSYTMFYKGDHPTAALYQVDPDQPNAVPDIWGVYIATDDVDAAAEKADLLGGSVAVEPFDVFEVGRMAVVQDPTGAVFCLWQAGEHRGVGVKNEHGALCWNELLTPDPSVAQPFYGELFDWRAESQEMPPPTGLYTSFMSGDTPVAGMMEIREEWGEVPPHWSTYFGVDDCDAAVAEALRLGGGLAVPAMDIPGVGRMAGLTDPLGAHFWVFRGEEVAAAGEDPDSEA